MAKKKKSSSMLPKDEFTPIMEDSFGNEGFQFFEDGTQAPVREKDLEGPLGMMPGIPDGIIRSASEEEEEVSFNEGPKVDYILDQTRTSRIPDLDWLAVSDKPKVLPSQNLDSLPELEAAWIDHEYNTAGKLRRQEVDLQFLKDTGQMKRKAAPEGPFSPLDIVRQAGRRSAAGVDWETIEEEARAKAGSSWDKIASSMERVKEEHGLVGKTHIRANFYPGCDKGKWSTYIQKTSSQAPLLVRGSKCGGCIHASEGRCNLLAKKFASDVWVEARDHFAKKASEAGVEFVPSDDPRADLEKFFSKRRASKKTQVPIHRPEMEKVSLEEAFEAAKAASVERKALKRQTLGERELKKKASYLKRLARTGLMTKDEIKSFDKNSASFRDLQEKVASHLLSARKGTYQGTQQKRNLNLIEASSRTAGAREKEAALAADKKRTQTRDTLLRMASSGQITKGQVSRILESGATCDRMLKAAKDLISLRSKKSFGGPVKSGHYMAPEPREKKVVKKASKKKRKKPTAGEVREKLASVMQLSSDSGKNPVDEWQLGVGASPMDLEFKEGSDDSLLDVDIFGGSLEIDD